MSTRIQILSGFDAKAPAAILISTPKVRLLLDAGGPLQADQPCDWFAGIEADALILSHDHVDHIGSVGQLPSMPVYATAPVATQLPEGCLHRLLPAQGDIDIGGIRLRCGRAGHSLGGVWLHLELAGGLFYSGDFSLESQLYPFDVPPPAATALLDASYGSYQTPQQHCLETLQALFAEPCLFPVPPSGRAIEMALWFDALGLTSWSMDNACYQALLTLLQQPAGLFASGTYARLQQLAMHYRGFDDQAQLLLAADPEGLSGEAGRLIADPGCRHQVIYTGYLPPAAQAAVEDGRARFARWNVHPRQQDVLWLAEQLQARRVMPLFTPLQRPHWQAQLGERLWLQHDFVLE